MSGRQTGGPRRKAAGKPPVDSSQLGSGGTIIASCRLSDYLVLLVGALSLREPERATFWLLTSGEWQELDTKVVPLAVRANGDERAADAAILVRESRIGGSALAGTLVVRTSDGDSLVGPVDLEATATDVSTLAREQLAYGDGPSRAALVSALLKSSSNERRSRRKLSESLFRIREALRAPLPRAVVEPGEARTAQVDAIWKLDDTAYYVEGWTRHQGAELASLVAVSPEGERVELVDTAFRHRRLDVLEFYAGRLDDGEEELGFVAYFELRTPSLSDAPWILELRDSEGGEIEVEMPPVALDPDAARWTILGDLPLEPPNERRLKDGHVRPALERLERRRLAAGGVAAVDEHGQPAAEPDVSVIVPLYRQVDLLEQQLAQFVDDPELARADLVYVLDSPEDAARLRPLAHHLFRLYRLPFRLAVLRRNGGYSNANNLGAELARGRLLLLLNSDVIPARPGWLGELVRFYDETDGIGALAPMLLYEDESIQHAGMYFHRMTDEGTWSNEHFFKGLHRTLPAANVTRPVPAVTGACLMIAADLYRELGGLRGSYVQGDFEDSDLCLRLSAAGYTNWYLPSVALYHLEGQSYPSSERELATRYNRWLHSDRWGAQIELAAAGRDLSAPRQPVRAR